LNKNNAAPLMLWFDSPDNMEMISNKKAALQETFKLFDKKSIGRIDATELFAIFLFASKGDYNVIIMSKKKF
jgi:Ca2+-binding EF-hand superfamily protein